MGRDEKQRKHDQRQREHKEVEETFAGFRRRSVYMKRVLRQRGINVPFYEFHDSYFEEFGKVAEQARQQFPSLLGIFEVEDAEYYVADRSQFAPELEQIFWDTKAEQNGYGTARDSSNVNGCTNAFMAEDGAVKTLVILRNSVPKLIREAGNPCEYERYDFHILQDFACFSRV